MVANEVNYTHAITKTAYDSQHRFPEEKYLLEVVKLLLQHLHLLQVGAHLLVGEGALLLVDPLLQLVGLAEQHELLAALLQHVLALVSQLQQSAVPVRRRRTQER